MSKKEEITENNLALSDELAILHSDLNDEVSGPFATVSGLKKALSK